MLLKLNSFIFYLRIFERQCNTPFVIYSDYIYLNITLLGERGVTFGHRLTIFEYGVDGVQE